MDAKLFHLVSIKLDVRHAAAPSTGKAVRSVQLCAVKNAVALSEPQRVAHLQHPRRWVRLRPERRACRCSQRMQPAYPHYPKRIRQVSTTICYPHCSHTQCGADRGPEAAMHCLLWQKRRQDHKCTQVFPFLPVLQAAVRRGSRSWPHLGCHRCGLARRGPLATAADDEARRFQGILQEQISHRVREARDGQHARCALQQAGCLLKDGYMDNFSRSRLLAV